MSIVLQKVVHLLCVPLLTTAPNPMQPDHLPHAGILHRHGEVAACEEGRVWMSLGGQIAWILDG